MSNFPRSIDHLPGTWKALRTPAGLSASICCPDCGFLISLGQHRIWSDGQVTPSVICTWEGCTWRGNVRLAGWKPEKRREYA